MRRDNEYILHNKVIKIVYDFYYSASFFIIQPLFYYSASFLLLSLFFLLFRPPTAIERVELRDLITIVFPEFQALLFFDIF